MMNSASGAEYVNAQLEDLKEFIEKCAKLIVSDDYIPGLRVAATAYLRAKNGITSEDYYIVGKGLMTIVLSGDGYATGIFASKQSNAVFRNKYSSGYQADISLTSSYTYKDKTVYFIRTFGRNVHDDSPFVYARPLSERSILSYPTEWIAWVMMYGRVE